MAQEIEFPEPENCEFLKSQFDFNQKGEFSFFITQTETIRKLLFFHY